MSSEQPKVPPRPARSSERSADPMSDVPQIPPRPQRRPDRSVSPMREGYSRSPLNELPHQSPSKDGKMYSQRNLSAQDLPPRPPSVNLPSIGQEGMEYANFEDAPSTSPEQHKTVSPDLPMHAPKASVPQTTATSRIQGVTRTDSSQAAAAGIGKAETEVHPLRAKASFSRSNLSLSHESTQEEHDHGIPEIGLQVPMLKFAGDVQAPTPTPSAQGTQGIGFADASQRNHHRKRSSRQEFHGPPGSYGLHGHRLDPQDEFEKAWYAKHPEELKKEHRPYDPGHAPGDWALSSEDLNKLVRDSANRGAGFATSPLVSSTPDEQIGYRASEQYTSRMNSPKPTPLSAIPKRPSSGAQPKIESPLKRQSFNLNGNDDHAMESEAEGEIIHVDPPAHRATKIGGGGYDPPTQDLGPEGGNTEEQGGWVVENGYGVPILASDEVAKNKDRSTEFLQPAVSPEMEKRGNDYYSAYESDSSNHGPSRRRSKEKLRTHSNDLTRFRSREAVQASGTGTPLEEIEEYEPLFPEDDEKKPLTAADKLKRPELARHHFPSQDIWEDAPESLQYQTTVSGPQEPIDLSASATFETPEKEQARKEGNDPTDRADFLTEETKKMAKSHFKPGVASEMSRPGQRRFPSSDIWEDVPDSLQLQTTVDTPQTEEQDVSSPADVRSPQDRPEVPARPARTKMADVTSPTSPTKPHIPARPKPQVPARPAKADASEEGAPLEKTISPPVKAKPAVPARPGGNKFAALKAGFLDNLNARIGLGPQAPPKQEEPAAEEAPVEKAPLADARKGRAKGPARRKPAAEAAATSTASGASSFSFGTTLTVFQIDDNGQLSVPKSAPSSGAAKGAQDIEKIASANTDAAAPAETTSTSAPEEEDKFARSGLPAQAVGHTGDIPEPKISDATLDRASAIQSEFQQALKSADAPAASGGTDVAASVPDRSSEVPVEGESATSGTRAEVETTESNTEAHTEQKHRSQMTDSSVQTGQQDISIMSPKGEEEKMTLMLGGRAPEEGNVVIKEDGEQIVGGMDEKHRTETTGHGM